MRTIILAITTILIPAAVSVQHVSAAQFINQQGRGDTLAIHQPTDDTLFIIGNNVEISNRVNGDIFVIGQSSVKITGSISQNLFVAANTVIIDGAIDADAFIFAGSLMLDDKTTIGKNVYAYSPQLTVKPNATVKGKIITPDKTEQPFMSRLNNHILATLALLVTGFMVAYFFPKTLQKSVEVSLEEWGGALLWGVIGLIATPIVGGILIVTRIGLPIGVIALTIYLIDLYLASVVVGATFGRLLTHGRLQLMWSMAVGIVFIQILRFAPGLSTVVTLAVIVWGLGALLLTKKTVAHHLRHDL